MKQSTLEAVIDEYDSIDENYSGTEDEVIDWKVLREEYLEKVLGCLSPELTRSEAECEILYDDFDECFRTCLIMPADRERKIEFSSTAVSDIRYLPVLAGMLREISDLIGDEIVITNWGSRLYCLYEYILSIRYIRRTPISEQEQKKIAIQEKLYSLIRNALSAKAGSYSGSIAWGGWSTKGIQLNIPSPCSRSPHTAFCLMLPPPQEFPLELVGRIVKAMPLVRQLQKYMHQSCTEDIELSISPEILKYAAPYASRIRTEHPMEQFLSQRTMTRLQSLAA